MPNWVQNNLTVSGNKETVEKVKNFVKSDDSDFDFNQIIKMPDILTDTESSLRTKYAFSYYAAKEFVDFSNLDKMICGVWGKRLGINTRENAFCELEKEFGGKDKILEDGRKLYDIYKTFGYFDWYHWALDNWGTKWNASEAESVSINDGVTVFYFHTAWSCVLKIVMTLSALFPGITFDYEWADEDFGCNLGRIKVKGGVVISQNIPQNGSKEAYALAEEILGYCAFE